MKIGILETGRPSAELEARFGRYDSMLRRLLGEDFTATTHAVTAGDYPERPEAYDGYVLTGSPAGVWVPLALSNRLQAIV